MEISNRTRSLIEVILNKHDYITIPEIVEELGISQRTIYRELPEIKELMAAFQVELISASKKGILARGSQSALTALRKGIGQQGRVTIIDPDQRADYFILYLLQADDYIKSEALAIDHGCALTTVRSDLKKIQEKIAHFDLRLIQQKGQGIRISGPLVEKNHLRTNILLDRVDETLLYQWMTEEMTVSDPFLNRMEEYGYRLIFHRTIRSMNELVPKVSTDFGVIRTRDFLELVILLSFMILQHGTEKPYHRFMDAKLDQKNQQKLFHLVTEKLKREFQIVCSEEELTYIRWMILVVFGKEHSIVSIRDSVLNADIIRLIQYVENRMGINLILDDELREGFYAHMDKALVRIRSNMQIVNPVLRDIKDSYAELFRVIRQGVTEQFPNDYFPEDEIAYLVLYFALSMDRMAKRLFKVLVVCSGGMGSSRMLASALEKEIPEIQVVKTASIVTLRQEKPEDYDLILSTIPLPGDEYDYLRVSPLLHKNEVELIHEKIQRHKHNRLRKIDLDEKEQEAIRESNNLDILKRVQTIGQFGIGLLSSSRVFDFDHFEDLRTSLEAVLNSKESNPEHVATIDPEGIHDYSFLLPDSEVAFYEAVLDAPVEPHIAVVRYRNGGFMPVGRKKTEFSAVIMAAYSSASGKEEKRILQYLIQQIIEDRDILAFISAGDLDSLVNWGAGKIRSYAAEILKSRNP
jgi:mannitol operon transcriptional antiterminator